MTQGPSVLGAVLSSVLWDSGIAHILPSVPSPAFLVCWSLKCFQSQRASSVWAFLGHMCGN